MISEAGDKTSAFVFVEKLQIAVEKAKNSVENTENDVDKQGISVENVDKENSLEERLLSFMIEADPYEYKDNITVTSSEEDELKTIKESLKSEPNTVELIEQLTNMIEEVDYDKELESKGKELLQEVKLVYAKQLINDFVEEEYGGTEEFMAFLNCQIGRAHV